MSINTVVSFLATGDELVQGDILNIDSQEIAKILIEHGFAIGSHVVAADEEALIAQGLEYLLAQADVVIVTGGLGPTSDDRTRYAVAKVVDKPLIHDEASWQHIVSRLQQHNAIVYESNRQQALFPEGAWVMQNPHGTANGCGLVHLNKIIYMFPGPPAECLPMFKEWVLPDLLKRFGSGHRKVMRWRLMGQAEAAIAEEFEKLAKDFPCTTGYRLNYPYVEAKLYIDDSSHDLSGLEAKIDQVFSSYLVNKSEFWASHHLKQLIAQGNYQFLVEDTATLGALQACLASPETVNYLDFTNKCETDASSVKIILAGLKAYWQGLSPGEETNFTLRLQFADKQQEWTVALPFRRQIMLNYVTEYVSWRILQFLSEIN